MGPKGLRTIRRHSSLGDIRSALSLGLIEGKITQADIAAEVKPVNCIVANINIFHPYVDKFSSIRLKSQLGSHPLHSHVMRLFSVLFWLSYCCFPVRATSVIAIHSGTTVILGADSRINSASDASAPISSCKIAQLARNQFVGASGVLTDPLYNVYAVAKNSTRLTVEDTAAEFERSMGSLIRSAARRESMRPLNESRLRREYINGTLPWISVAFVAFEDTRTQMAFREFRAMEKKGIVTILCRSQICPGPECSSGITLWRLGFADAPATFREALTIIGQTRSMASAVQRLIVMEIDRHPSEVFWPIDILVVTPGRADWNPGNSQGCPAIQ